MFKVLTFFSIIIIIIFTLSNACGSLAQPVEHRTVNPSVAGSSPAGAAKGAVQKEMDSPNYFKFTSEFKSAKI